jgi:integrase
LIDPMPRPRLPFLHKEITRHQKVTWYVRHGKGPRIRVRGEYGSAEFRANYEAALEGRTSTTSQRRTKSGSLAWLIDRYRDSAAWSSLAPATRRQRDNIFLHVIESAGDKPCSKITKQVISAARDRRKATPFAANNFLKAMRGLFRWASEAGFVATDPTASVKLLASKTDGFHAWSEAEIEKFEARWPIGTRERLALAIMLYTGLRRGDAAKLGHQHVRNGVIVLRTEKTGTPVTIPILPELAAVIEASATGDLAFVAQPNGRPMTKESFGNWFKDACNAAGVPGSCHGLRKAGAARAASNGATELELNAIFGWTGPRQAINYTRTANRERLAMRAMEKLRTKK